MEVSWQVTGVRADAWALANHSESKKKRQETNQSRFTTSTWRRLFREATPTASAAEACAWRIVISPMIPQDFPYCYYSSTLLGLHKVLSKQRTACSSPRNRRRKPGPNGPSVELIHAVVEMKQRNPRAVREWPNSSPWRSTSPSTKTWFAGFWIITTGRDKTPVAPPG
jgi:hypothetical protein